MTHVLMPAEPPADLGSVFDAELFDLCRSDDYSAIYRVLVKRYGLAPATAVTPPPPAADPPCW